MIHNKNKLIIFVIIIILIALGLTKFLLDNNGRTVNLKEIKDSDFEFYILKDEEKYGVIDKTGKIIIEPQYEKVMIPNPTTDMFIVSNNIDEEIVTYKAINSSNQQVFTNYESIEAITINPLESNVPYEKTVLKYKENNLYGLIDFSGKKITDAIYEEISCIDYKEGYLKCKKDGFYGVVNINGKKIINYEYDNITSDGYYNEQSKYQKSGFLLKVKTDEGYRYGYANYKGKITSEPMFNDIGRITEIKNDNDIYLISSTKGSYGLIKNGKSIIENKFTDISFNLSSNLLIVTQGKSSGVYDLNAKVILPIDYDSILIGGEYINATKESTRIVFDKSGNQLDTKYQSYIKTDDSHGIIIDENNLYNIVDSKNKKQLKNEYIYIEYFKNGLYIATKDGKTGMINITENEIIPFEYDTIQAIQDTNTLEAYKLQNGQIDMVKENGTVVKGLEKAQISKTDDYIKIISETGLKYFDLNGNEISYKSIYPNNKLYASCKDGKWGFIDKAGNVVIDYKYDMVTEQNGNVAGIKLENLWGIIDENGNVILEPKYKINSDYIKFLSIYYEVIDNFGNRIYTLQK